MQISLRPIPALPWWPASSWVLAACGRIGVVTVQARKPPVAFRSCGPMKTKMSPRALRRSSPTISLVDSRRAVRWPLLLAALAARSLAGILKSRSAKQWSGRSPTCWLPSPSSPVLFARWVFIPNKRHPARCIAAHLSSMPPVARMPKCGLPSVVATMLTGSRFVA